MPERGVDARRHRLGAQPGRVGDAVLREPGEEGRAGLEGAAGATGGTAWVSPGMTGGVTSSVRAPGSRGYGALAPGSERAVGCGAARLGFTSLDEEELREATRRLCAALRAVPTSSAVVRPCERVSAIGTLVEEAAVRDSQGRMFAIRSGHAPVPDPQRVARRGHRRGWDTEAARRCSIVFHPSSFDSQPDSQRRETARARRARSLIDHQTPAQPLRAAPYGCEAALIDGRYQVDQLLGRGAMGRSGARTTASGAPMSR